MFLTKIPPISAPPTRFGEEVYKVQFEGFWNHRSHCFVELLRGTAHTVPLVTEAWDNPGTSVTNRAEHLVTGLVQVMGLEQDKFTYIERYKERARLSASNSDRLDVVKFTWDEKGCASHPVWRVLKCEEIAALQSLTQD